MPAFPSRVVAAIVERLRVPEDTRTPPETAATEPPCHDAASVPPAMERLGSRALTVPSCQRGISVPPRMVKPAPIGMLVVGPEVPPFPIKL